MASHWLLLWVWLLIWAHGASAMLEAHVDRNLVGVDDSLTLTLAIDGNTDDEPDLTGLDADFVIQSRAQSTAVQIINGRSSRKTQWHITLMPKRAGQLLIPAITMGGERSTPIKLTVSAEPATANPQSSDLFLEVSVAPQESYVQQQLLYTVRLWRSVELGPGSSLSEPAAGSDLVVERLGDGSEYQTTRDGRRYTVVERRYALYPQKSGAMTIDPILFNGSVVESSRSNNSLFLLDPFNHNTRPRRLRSAVMAVQVQPIPPAVSGQWLPARGIQLVQSWSPDPPKFIIGEPVTRTIALIADGLTAAQLPLLNGMNLDGIKQYPDQPTLNDNRDGNGIIGTRQEKSAMIPTQVGRFTLPAITIPWWNTATNRPDIATLPAYTIEVLPDQRTVVPTPDAIALPTLVPQTIVNQAPTLTVTANNEWSRLVIFGLTLGWAATVLAWWYQRHQRAAVINQVPPHAPSRNHHQAARLIEQGCRANDPKATKTALLAWGNAQWPQHPPTNLTVLAARINDLPLTVAMVELDRALYAHEVAGWEGRQLWQAFNQNIRTKQHARIVEPSEVLVPLRSFEI